MGSLVELGELRRVSIGGGAPQSLPVKPWSPSWGDIARDGRIVYRASRDSGEVYDPRTNQRRPIANLLGDPSWAPDGRAIAFAIPPAAGSAQAGLWIEPFDGPRRQVFRGWVLWFAWTSGGQLLVLEGKANLKGVIWQVDTFGDRKVVLPDVALPMRHSDVSIAVRFDVHPDGHRIVIEALESLEADIGLIDNVR
jgi:hypothetical protein